MARRSSVHGLSAEVKRWLDGALIDNHFAQYEQLAAALRERGYHISKSSLHRYGQGFQERLGALRLATEQARAISEEVGDDAGAMNDVLIRMTQQRIFDVLMLAPQTDEAGQPIPLDPRFVQAIGRLATASVRQSEWAAKARARIDAEVAKIEQAHADKPDALAVLEQVRAAYRGHI